MKEIIDFLKNTVDRSRMSVAATGCYIIRDGQIYTRNMSMHAGVPMESEINFNIPADAFEAAIARMRDIESLTVEDNIVKIKSGRLRSSIRLVMEDPPEIPTMPTEWLRTPPELSAALAVAKDHTSDDKDDGWKNCVRLMDGRVTAFRSQSGIDIAVPDLVFKPSLFTTEVIDFLIAQGGSDEYASEPNAASFRWDDGRWMRCKLYDSEMPETSIATIFENAGTEIPIQITSEFRDAYADASAMTEKVIMMTPEGFQGRTGDVANTSVEFKIDGLPDGHVSYWDKKYLDPVIAQAVGWNPTTWPAPSYYEAPGIRGVVMGRARW